MWVRRPDEHGAIANNPCLGAALPVGSAVERRTRYFGADRRPLSYISVLLQFPSRDTGEAAPDRGGFVNEELIEVRRNKARLEDDQITLKAANDALVNQRISLTGQVTQLNEEASKAAGEAERTAQANRTLSDKQTELTNSVRQLELQRAKRAKWSNCDQLARLTLSLPATLGIEMAGVVLRTGPGVKGLKRGDRVMAALGGVGAYAHHLVINAEKLVLTPSALSDVEAAAIPVAAMTAWHVIQAADFDLSGRRVLIHGAAGGVGGFAVQFAKAAGATVYATASTMSLPHVLSAPTTLPPRKNPSAKARMRMAGVCVGHAGLGFDRGHRGRQNSRASPAYPALAVAASQNLNSGDFSSESLM